VVWDFGSTPAQPTSARYCTEWIVRRKPGHLPLPFHYGLGRDGYRLVERLRQTMMTWPA